MTTGTGRYEALLERCRALQPVATAVAHPCEETALADALEAARQGLIVPIPVAPAHKLQAVSQAAGLDRSGHRIVDVPHSHAAAE